MQDDLSGSEEQETIDFSSLPSEIKDLIRKFLILSEDQYTILWAWIIHTWRMDLWQVTPYIWVHSKDPGSGKTLTLDVISLLARNPIRADDMTTPVMFKLIERECPTLLWDEIDTVWSGSRNESKRRTVNTGYKRGGCAYRQVANDYKKFSTFCAKVLCGINNGYLPPTIIDRAIPFELKKKSTDQKVERFNEFFVRGSAELEAILSKIELFVEVHYVDLFLQRPEPMQALSDRQNEIVEPLLAIANVLGSEKEMREALRNVFSHREDAKKSPMQMFFERIRDVFGDADRIHTETLCQVLGPYNGRQLALILEPYGIRPSDQRIGNEVKKGYRREQFDEVFAQMLDPIGYNDEVEVEAESEMEEAA